MVLFRYSSLNEYERSYYDQIVQKHGSVLVYRQFVPAEYIIKTAGTEFRSLDMIVALREALNYDKPNP